LFLVLFLVLAFLSPINCLPITTTKKAIIQTMQKKKDFGTMGIPIFFAQENSPETEIRN
jgi:hypothetical protein